MPCCQPSNTLIVSLLISLTVSTNAALRGTSPSARSLQAGSIVIKNSCSAPLSIKHKSALGGILTTLSGSAGLASGETLVQPLHGSPMTVGGSNVFFAYPMMDNEQHKCPDCCAWGEALGPYYQHTQREGWMWMGENAKYAAYCNPSIARGVPCNAQAACGPEMTMDGTFGTHFEITPTSGNDSANLSTNYGSGPYTPPHLCPYGDGNDCVSTDANIFFNIPIKWWTESLSGSPDCTFRAGEHQTMQNEFACSDVACKDAYMHPTDDKQVTCPASPERTYYVEYCADGNDLPSVN